MDAEKTEQNAYRRYSLPTLDVVSVLNRDTLGHVVDLVDTDQTRGEFELDCVSPKARPGDPG